MQEKNQTEDVARELGLNPYNPYIVESIRSVEQKFPQEVRDAYAAYRESMEKGKSISVGKVKAALGALKEACAKHKEFEDVYKEAVVLAKKGIIEELYKENDEKGEMGKDKG